MATLDELATLVAAATALQAGSTLFKGRLPETPDVCASLHETPGSAPDHLMGQAGIATEYPRAQLVFRGATDDYEGPRAMAEAAYRYLAAVANRVVGSTRWFTITPLQPPFQIRARDAKGRYHLGFNIAIEKELSAA
jgi:hypothetical protein